MRALGFLALMGIIIGGFVLLGLIVLAYLGIKAAMDEEKKRRKKEPEPARRDGPVPMFPVKRKEE